MSRDSRKKGCPNEGCDMNKKKHRFKADDKFCSKCGTELVFVCPKCFSRITDDGPHHKYCALCEAKQVKPTPIRKVQRAVRHVQHAGKKVRSGAKNTKDKVGRKVKRAGDDVKGAIEANNVQEELLNAGVKAVKDIGEVAIKEAENVAKRKVREAVKKQ